MVQQVVTLLCKKPTRRNGRHGMYVHRIALRHSGLIDIVEMQFQRGNGSSLTFVPTGNI